MLKSYKDAVELFKKMSDPMWLNTRAPQFIEQVTAILEYIQVLEHKNKTLKDNYALLYDDYKDLQKRVK